MSFVEFSTAGMKPTTTTSSGLTPARATLPRSSPPSSSRPAPASKAIDESMPLGRLDLMQHSGPLLTLPVSQTGLYPFIVEESTKRWPTYIHTKSETEKRMYELLLLDFAMTVLSHLQRNPGPSASSSSSSSASFWSQVVRAATAKLAWSSSSSSSFPSSSSFSLSTVAENAFTSDAIRTSPRSAPALSAPTKEAAEFETARRKVIHAIQNIPYLRHGQDNTRKWETRVADWLIAWTCNILSVAASESPLPVGFTSRQEEADVAQVSPLSQKTDDRKQQEETSVTEPKEEEDRRPRVQAEQLKAALVDIQSRLKPLLSPPASGSSSDGTQVVQGPRTRGEDVALKVKRILDHAESFVLPWMRLLTIRHTLAEMDESDSDQDDDNVRELKGLKRLADDLYSSVAFQLSVQIKGAASSPMFSDASTMADPSQAVVKPTPPPLLRTPSTPGGSMRLVGGGYHHVPATPHSSSSSSSHGRVDDPLPLFTPLDATQFEGYSFELIVGQDEAKQMLRRSFIQPFLYPNLNGELPGGLLLYGPPGTGKTELIRAAVRELACKLNPEKSKVYLFAPMTSELLGKYVGQSERFVTHLFDTAKRWACAYNDVQHTALGDEKTNYNTLRRGHSIIFLDEIEAIARPRGQDGGEINDKTTNTLLQAMQGVQRSDNVTVIAATNFPWLIDSAVLRRFDQRIPFRMPGPLQFEQFFNLELSRHFYHRYHQRDRAARNVFRSCHTRMDKAQFPPSTHGVPAAFDLNKEREEQAKLKCGLTSYRLDDQTLHTKNEEGTLTVDEHAYWKVRPIWDATILTQNTSLNPHIFQRALSPQFGLSYNNQSYSVLRRLSAEMATEGYSLSDAKQVLKLAAQLAAEEAIQDAAMSENQLPVLQHRDKRGQTHTLLVPMSYPVVLPALTQSSSTASASSLSASPAESVTLLRASKRKLDVAYVELLNQVLSQPKVLAASTEEKQKALNVRWMSTGQNTWMSQAFQSNGLVDGFYAALPSAADPAAVTYMVCVRLPFQYQSKPSSSSFLARLNPFSSNASGSIALFLQGTAEQLDQAFSKMESKPSNLLVATDPIWTSVWIVHHRSATELVATGYAKQPEFEDKNQISRLQQMIEHVETKQLLQFTNGTVQLDAWIPATQLTSSDTTTPEDAKETSSVMGSITVNVSSSPSLQSDRVSVDIHSAVAFNLDYETLRKAKQQIRPSVRSSDRSNLLEYVKDPNFNPSSSSAASDSSSPSSSSSADKVPKDWDVQVDSELPSVPSLSTSTTTDFKSTSASSSSSSLPQSTTARNNVWSSRLQRVMGLRNTIPGWISRGVTTATLFALSSVVSMKLFGGS